MLSIFQHPEMIINSKKQSEAIYEEHKEHKDLSEDIHKTQHR